MKSWIWTLNARYQKQSTIIEGFFLQNLARKVMQLVVILGEMHKLYLIRAAFNFVC